MKSRLRKTWDALQPALAKPRWWVASVLRQFLFRTRFIAITGSNGKTTAVRYLAAILSAHAPTQWTRLNRNGPGGITETIAFCRPWKTRYAIFEVGFGELGRIATMAKLVRPHVAAVLSVFLEHRSLLKTLDNVASEKAGLLQALQPGGVAVLNADDPRVAGMPVPAGRTIIRFGKSPENDAWYENAESAWPVMLRFTVVIDGQRRDIRTRLLGTHWVPTLVSCIAIARHLGVPFDTIVQAIEQVPPYPGRMQVMELPSGAVVIRDEFKGSRHTIETAFEELRKATAERKILVVCDEAESPRGPGKRLPRIGRDAAGLADYVLFIGESAHHGVAGATKAGVAGDRALSFADYQEAAAFLKPMLGPGDVVLLKAGRNNQLPRLFYSLIGEVRCTLPTCRRPMVCDDCPEFDNPELVQLANERLIVS